MKKIILCAALLSILTPALAFAAHGSFNFLCKVTSFDKTTVSLACDPKNPKASLKTPKSWLAKADSLRFDSKTMLSLDDQGVEKWLAMNKPAAKNGASK